jgi:hypothetical protein
MEQSRMLHKKSMFFKKHIRTTLKVKGLSKAKVKQQIAEIDQQIIALKQKFHDGITDDDALVLMNKIHDLRFAKAKLNDEYILTPTQKAKINLTAEKLGKKMQMEEF